MLLGQRQDLAYLLLIGHLEGGGGGGCYERLVMSWQAGWRGKKHGSRQIRAGMGPGQHGRGGGGERSSISAPPTAERVANKRVHAKRSSNDGAQGSACLDDHLGVEPVERGVRAVRKRAHAVGVLTLRRHARQLCSGGAGRRATVSGADSRRSVCSPRCVWGRLLCPRSKQPSWQPGKLASGMQLVPAASGLTVACT